MNTKQSDSDKFLKNYGRAFIAINYVETLLEHLLLKAGKLDQVPENVKNKLLEGTTLGRKFSLSKSLIEDANLKKKIGKIIEKRKLIAHKFLHIHFNNEGEADEFTFDGKQLLIKENFLPKLVILAVEAGEGLLKELEKY